MILEALGRILRGYRKQSGLKLWVLADRTGLSLGYLSQIELGHASASIDSLTRIAGALDVKLSRLFAEAEAVVPEAVEVGMDRGYEL